MNLVTILLILVKGELAVRVGARSLGGEVLGNVALEPKNWDLTGLHYRTLIEKAGGDLSYLVYDDRMGWSIGSSQRALSVQPERGPGSR